MTGHTRNRKPAGANLAHNRITQGWCSRMRSLNLALTDCPAKILQNPPVESSLQSWAQGTQESSKTLADLASPEIREPHQTLCGHRSTKIQPLSDLLTWSVKSSAVRVSKSQKISAESCYRHRNNWTAKERPRDRKRLQEENEGASHKNQLAKGQGHSQSVNNVPGKTYSAS